VDGHDKVYTIKLACTKMQNSLIGERSVVFKSTWRVKGTPSPLHLAWRVMSNGIHDYVD